MNLVWNGQTMENYALMKKKGLVGSAQGNLERGCEKVPYTELIQLI